MREVRWERMFPDQLEAEFERFPAVYYSYGLCEPHGPQNALGLDGIKAHAIACEVARSTGGIAAPPDYWHVHELGGYALWAEQNVGEVKRKWLTSIPPWVHFKNVCYHIRSADQIGFHAAIFITGHYGPNWEDLKTLLELAQEYTRTRLYGLPDFEANQPGFDNDRRSGGDHAGKVETSLLWSLAPECVDVSRIADDVEHPAFAMGQDAKESSRVVGDRMVRDEANWIRNKVDELLDAYDPKADAPGFPTFESVEQFWDQKVRPELSSFRSMSVDFGNGGTVEKKSVWYPNWSVPDRS